MRRAVALSLTLVAIALALAVAGYAVMIDVKPRGPRAAADARARAGIATLESRLRRHVEALAGDIGERNLERPDALQAAVGYIRRAWTAQGLAVSEESFAVGTHTVRNLIVEKRGVSDPTAILLVGAHYDTAPGTPGANDNGSGVALLLEMSAMLARAPHPRTIRFVAFVNEEPPHFFSDAMGSRVHARRARERGERIVGMLSLETLGYYTEAPRSQHYPFPFGLLYPSSGNFLAVVGNIPSRGLVREFMRHFMAAGDFPVEGAATFEWVPGITWSDHWAFWQEGYPAIMLTDTAPFRYPEYHSRRDLPDKIAWPEYARAGHGIIRAVAMLAGTPGT